MVKEGVDIEIGNYYINWFRYFGLYNLYLIPKLYFGVQIDFPGRLLIIISLLLLCIEKKVNAKGGYK